ncbi:hypothetical protein BDF20DRAFT_832807 [Mycotypha africana]|uniref:uncharacterized protein n=1 Tax=Mycotypha africana TaxID=64632 RepID=UPI002300BEE7|nr:uncharacterized protein BDF20DRAFT_832807 [Mycotypha africana]KAI8987923.1 hypothetical protein BDF20DRAFT_832807 [Mycotypha africana]
MLEFQKQILTEIVSEDGLLILSPGLGLFTLLSTLAQVYANGQHLVILINTTKEQDDILQEHLQGQLKRIEYNVPAERRSSMYRQGGIFSITSRILAVDMLLNRIPVELINGIIVYNAHRVKLNSIEELILRIYREKNEEGFIKAFSDRPDQFVSGFAPLQNTLKSLNLRKVHLWPRFHMLVSDNLSNTNNNVIELRQPMTESMNIIQQSLVECMEETLSDLRRNNSSLIDIEEIKVENAFFKSFDQIVRRQLDPIWHRVSTASKQLVGDLKILRQLLTYLTAYDCVSFYSFIETVLAANTPQQDGRQVIQSQWLLTDAGNRAVMEARKRVYIKQGDPEYDELPEQSHQQEQRPDVLFPKHIKLVLEEQPKWNLLKTILKEIEDDSENLDDAPVLIMVSERRTCSQLKEYITCHAQEAQRFFSWRVNMHRLQMGNRKGITQQQQQNQQQQQQQQQPTFRGRPPPNKRRRVRGGLSQSPSNRQQQTLAQTFQQDVLDTVAALDEEINDEDEDDDDTLFKGIIGPLTDAEEIKNQHLKYRDTNSSNMDVSEDDANKDTILPSFEEIPSTSLITIQCYEEDTNDQILEDTQPRFVILYDPHPTFIRQLEVYRAAHPSVNIRVYFMLYENSVEEQNYLNLIKKEKECFEKLIHEKSIMAIPLADKPKGNRDELILQRRVTDNTRVAGGQLKAVLEPHIVTVDMREFRSSLPPILYAEGIQIEPYTLQIGDYILSPDMCVERKSLSDLIQSFNSGRLYTQCESMSLHYKIPILLIEFEENKSFSLQALSDIRENIRLNDLSSKLVILTLAFPKLRIIWSSNPHETAKIFMELKRTEEEPDSKTAAAIGAEGVEDGETIYNMTAQEMLRSMPGITSKNYHVIMNEFEDLDELVNANEKRIAELIGEENARKLKITLAEQKLAKLVELNQTLKQTLDIPRVPVSEASQSLIDFCQSTEDLMIPSVWGEKHSDPFAEPVHGCGSCQIM